MLLVDTPQKFRKNPRFWEKSISTKFEKFESISTEVGSPPPQITLIYYPHQGAILQEPSPWNEGLISRSNEMFFCYVL